MTKEQGALKTLAMLGQEIEAQPEQEPSVYIRKDQLQKAAQSAMLCEVTPELRQDRIRIYTAAPLPERPWVGLTEDDVNNALYKYHGWREFAAELERLLKDKNYG